MSINIDKIQYIRLLIEAVNTDTLEDIQAIIDSDPEELTNASETIQQFYNALKIMVETGNDVSPIYPIFQKLKKESL